jgi:hypothetical protein
MGIDKIGFFMKYILQIAAHLTIGGAEKVCRDIGLYGNPEEYETHYIIFDDDIGDFGREVEAKGCKIFKLHEPSDNYGEYFRELKKLMAKFCYISLICAPCQPKNSKIFFILLFFYFE